MVDLSGTGQGFETRRTTVDLSVEPADYFGRPVRQLSNADLFGLRPAPEKDLYRVQYLFLMVFGNSDSPTDYGGIQVRAKTYLYLEDGTVNLKMQKIMQRAAHRGAYLFDSPLEHPTYGGGGGNWGDSGGYLDGFEPVEMGGEYRNWEVEPVGSAEGKPTGAQPGRIDWTTEIYLEVNDAGEYANLSGVAQGVSNPYRVKEHYEPPTQPVEAQQEWWEVTFNDAKGSYDIHPPGRSASKARAKRLHEKSVYLNGLKIGSVTVDGRVWLKKQYQNGLTYRGDNSKESVVERTEAAPQSIRGTSENPGKLAKIDESPRAVHLATAGAREDFDPVDPDEVDPDRLIIEGDEGGSVYLLTLPDLDDPTTQECRQDDQLIRHLGYSEPRYSHNFAETWNWPGFRSIAEHGAILRPEDYYTDDDQTGLGSFEGDDR